MGKEVQAGEQPQKTSKKTILIGVIFLVVVLLLTFFTIIKNVSISDIVSVISKVNPALIVLGIVFMFIFSVGEGMNMRRPLLMTGYNTTFWQGLKYGIAGFFFSSITPSSTGGQPMQLYYMHKDGVKTAHGMLAIFIQLLGYESGSLIFAVIGFLTMGNKLDSIMGKGKYALLIGIFVNLFMLCFVLVCLFSERTIKFICRVLVRFFSMINGKGKNRIIRKIENVVVEYGGMSGHFKGHMDIVWKTVVTSCVQFAAMFSVCYLVYRGLGFTEYNFIEVLLLQAVLYVAVGFIPIPGASGVSEGVSMIIYKLLYPTSMIAGAVVLTRCINLYFMIVIYGVIVFIFTRAALKKGTVPHQIETNKEI